MKKLLCTFISALLFASASIPVFAMEIENTGKVEPQLATLRSGTSTKTYYFNISETYNNVPLQVKMVWSLTYFVDTGKVSTCSTPMVTATFPSDYPYATDLIPRIKSVTTSGQKSGDYACRFTAIYEPVVANGADNVEYFKPMSSFIVTVVADGEVSEQ